MLATMPSKLYALTHSILDMDRRGGSLIQKDDNTVIAYDLSDICISDIYAMFLDVGGVTVHVKTMSSGIGGFFVLIEQKKELCILKSAEFLFLLECIGIFVICSSYAQVAMIY